MAAVAAAAAEAAAATAGAAGAAGADAGGAGGALLLAEPSLVLRAGRRGLGPLYARFLASPHFLPWLQEVHAIAAGYTPTPLRSMLPSYHPSQARAITAEAGRPAARPRHPRPPPAPSADPDPPRSLPDGAGPAAVALPALDPWQLALLQEQAVQTCRQHALAHERLILTLTLTLTPTLTLTRQHALEHERLRETTAFDAKSPAGAQARAAWRRLQSAETHLAWLRSVQSAL